MLIREDDLRGEQTVRLLGAHLTNMQEITPAGSVHALAVHGLRSADITVWSAWEGDEPADIHTRLVCRRFRRDSPSLVPSKSSRTGG